MMSWMDFVITALGDFLAALIGGGIARGREGGLAEGSIARKIADYLKPHMFGWGHEDEGAMERAVSNLRKRDSVLVERVLARIRTWVADGHQGSRAYNAVRMSLAVLSEEDAVNWLETLAELSEEAFNDAMIVTGAAYAGRLHEVLPTLRKWGVVLKAKMDENDRRGANFLRRLRGKAPLRKTAVRKS
jgi:hypothetical protein